MEIITTDVEAQIFDQALSIIAAAATSAYTLPDFFIRRFFGSPLKDDQRQQNKFE